MDQERSQEPSDEHEARLSLMYLETGRVIATFFDWRHRVIVICSTALVFTFAIVSWMYQQRLGGVAMFFPLLVGAVMAYMCSRFDRRNGQIIEACYGVAGSLEEVLRQPSDTLINLPEGVYTRVEKSRRKSEPDPPEAPQATAEPDSTETSHTNSTAYSIKTDTYGRLLKRWYLGLFVGLGLLALAALALGIVAPDELRPPR